MKLFFHFTSPGRATTYLLGPDEGGDAILVDPGSFDTKLLTVIEQNHFSVSAVLFTHGHDNHTRRSVRSKRSTVPPSTGINAPCSVSTFIRFRDMRRSISVPSTSKPRRYPAIRPIPSSIGSGTCSSQETPFFPEGSEPRRTHMRGTCSSRRFPGAFFPSRGKRSSYRATGLLPSSPRRNASTRFFQGRIQRFLKEIPEKFGKGRPERTRFFVSRQGYGQAMGMQEEREAGIGLSVHRIPDNRVPDMPHMDTQLMCPSR